MPASSKKQADIADDFEYDVAFSFLSGDVKVAERISGLLRNRYRTFVFTEQQKEITFRDGLEVFRGVFQDKSRCVAILFRGGWGSTKWTRIEEDLIKDRAVNKGKGWDFLLLINLDPSANTPAWLPASYIWHDYSEYGAEGAAGAIGLVIHRGHGRPRPETIEEMALRTQHALAYEQRRERFRETDAGFQTARIEVPRLFDMIDGKCAAIKGAIRFSPRRFGQTLYLLHDLVSMEAQWKTGGFASLKNSDLEISYWSGRPVLPDQRRINILGLPEPSRFRSQRFALDISVDNDPVWTPLNGDTSRTYGTDRLAEYLLATLLEEQQKRSRR